MKRNVGYGFLMLKQRMRAAAACAGHFASRFPTPTLPQLPALPQQVRCVTTFASTERFSYSYSIEGHSTSSHTVFNGTLHGKPMSVFKVYNVLDVIHWKSDSINFISESCLSIQFHVQNSKGCLFFTERVECTLKEYLRRFPNKYESLNTTAIIPEIRHVLGGVLDVFLKYRSDNTFRQFHLENLYWTGSKVVVLMFRKELSAKQLSDLGYEDLSAKELCDLDYLKVTLTDMFDGALPSCLKELLTQIDKKSLPLQYLLDNHYSLMGSQERISYRTYVVRNMLESSVRSGNAPKLDTYWKNDPICKLVQPVGWKNVLITTYGSNAKRWNSQPEDPIQYLIMARNIAEHFSHKLSASRIDEDVIDSYPGHADAILVCIHGLHPHLNFVKLKGLK